MPVMYDLPKVHKPAVPLRPILSAIGGFNHEAVKWLTGKLSFLQNHPTYIKNSFKFIDNIKDKCFQNKILVSFDVKSLITNISASFTIKLITDALYHNGKSSNSNALFNGFNQTKMKQILERVTKNGTFLFNYEYCDQIDGVPMEGKASNLSADVIMRQGYGGIHITNFLCFTNTWMIASVSLMTKNGFLSWRKF